MLLNIWQILILIGCGVAAALVVALLGVFVGAWLVFKVKMAVPGESFLGGVPKGEVYSIPDALEAAEFPEEESKAQENVLKRTEQFLAKLSGR